MRTETINRAEECRFEIVETTKGMNDYPEGIGKAVMGFNSYEEASKFADEIGGKVVELVKRDGHYFWVNHGIMIDDFEIKPEMYGDNCTSETDLDDWWQGESQCISNMLPCAPEDFFKETERLRKIYEKLADCGENFQVILMDGEYYETIEKKTQSYHEDVWQHEIGVVEI